MVNYSYIYAVHWLPKMYLVTNFFYWNVIVQSSDYALQN